MTGASPGRGTWFSVTRTAVNQFSVGEPTNPGVAAKPRGGARQDLPSACTPGSRITLYPGDTEEAVERGVDVGAFGFHRGPVQRTDIVQVDINRKSIEADVEEVERVPPLSTSRSDRTWSCAIS